MEMKIACSAILRWMLLAGLTGTVQASASSYDRQIQGLGVALGLAVTVLCIYVAHYVYTVWAEKRDKGKESFATAEHDDTSSSSSSDDNGDLDGDSPAQIRPVEEVSVSVSLGSADSATASGQTGVPGNDSYLRLNNEIMARTLSDRCRLPRKSFSMLAQEFVRDMDEELGNIDDDMCSTKSGSMVSGTSSLSIYDDTSSCQSRIQRPSGRITPLGSHEDAWREFLDSPDEEDALPRSSSLNAAPMGSVSPKEYDFPNPTCMVL